MESRSSKGLPVEGVGSSQLYMPSFLRLMKIIKYDTSRRGVGESIEGRIGREVSYQLDGSVPKRFFGSTRRKEMGNVLDGKEYKGPTRKLSEIS